MSYSFSTSETTTFTVTHAKYLASKVATDLKRMQRLYERPSDYWIREFDAELVAFLKAGYLGTVTYGFLRNEIWIPPMLRYTAYDLVNAFTVDDDPGRVLPGSDIRGAHFSSFLTFGGAWDYLSAAQKATFLATLPFQRVGGREAGSSGILVDDKTYSAGGRSLGRATLRSW